MSALPSVSAVIPTFGRGDVLLRTIDGVLGLDPPPLELLVVDQTPEGRQEAASRLRGLHEAKRLGWLRLKAPSIPKAMNEGLKRARGDIVLFLDDDVEPAPDLIAAHARAHAGSNAEIVAGQALQPGEEPEALAGIAFDFRSSVAQPVAEVIGCNFSVRRDFALRIGGFDANFVAVAYRFEAEFCERALAAGARIDFEPAASLRHLRAPRGGTRAYGNHLRTVRPAHAVGEYYFLLKSRRTDRWLRMLARPLRAIRTRHHLRRPWWIPVTLAAEFAGWWWAVALKARGARTLTPGRGTGAAR
ncbi:MAG TPA: glycosyltransferase [Planctomycetota bacterium]|nr:glycosyltransferase [Planctomycetota bacterium]